MAERIQVAMEPTSQTILKDTAVIKADTADMKPRVQNIQTNVQTMGPKIESANSNIGNPSDSASNSSSASVHRKLNWLLNNSTTKSVLKVSGTEANIAGAGFTNQNGFIQPYAGGSANSYLSVYGSGRLLYLAYGENKYAVYVKIDGKVFNLNYEGVFDLPFSSSLIIEHGGVNPPRLIYYELNQ